MLDSVSQRQKSGKTPRTYTDYRKMLGAKDLDIVLIGTPDHWHALQMIAAVESGADVYVQKEGKSNTTDTQTATFEYDDLNIVWQHRSWGSPPDADYPWALILYGDKGTLKASVTRYDFIPRGKGESIHKDCIYEREQFPEDVTENDIELHAAPATRLHMLDFLAAIEDRSRPIADIEEGHISTASCILANVAMELGRPLVYDPKNRRIVGDKAANELLSRPYRKPWKHPEV